MRGLEHFSLVREPAPADLSNVIEGFWLVRWDLGGRPPFHQEVLPYPCVNVVFEDGRFMAHGPCTKRFVARLSGVGWVLGAKFTPAGFARLASVQMRALVDRDGSFAAPGYSKRRIASLAERASIGPLRLKSSATTIRLISSAISAHRSGALPPPMRAVALLGERGGRKGRHQRSAPRRAPTTSGARPGQRRTRRS